MRIKRSALIALLVVCLPIAAGVTWVVHGIRTYQRGFREYQEAHSPVRIVGRTESEIERMYGPPYTVSRDKNGRPDLIVYKDVPHGQYCGISMEKGVAVRVEFSGQ